MNVNMYYAVVVFVVLNAGTLYAEENLLMRDCQDVKKISDKTGVYTIYPKGMKEVQVRCDMDTDDGGWTVIQRRVNDSDFYKTWNEYQAGFGTPDGNYWLGNEYIHRISTSGSYELRVDLSTTTESAYAKYQVFFTESAKLGYTLFVDGYSGTAGDSLTSHNGYKFSTKDRDNDVYTNNCATVYTGAWWYEKCHYSNLNGDYGNTAYAKGPVWEEWKGYYEPMVTTEMKIRRL